MLGCLCEAIETAEHAEATTQAVDFEVPWLTDATWVVLDASWRSISADAQGTDTAAYGEAFFEALYADAPNCVSGAVSPILSPCLPLADSLTRCFCL